MTTVRRAGPDEAGRLVLPRDSVVNVTGLITLDKVDLAEPVGELPAALMREIDQGLRRVLAF